MFGYYEERTDKDIYMFTDLAVERRRADNKIDGVSYSRKKTVTGSLETVRISSDEGERSIGKPKGIYLTINTERMDELNQDEIEDTTDELARCLCEICDEKRMIPGRILVVGLGNRDLTPDSLGPRVADKVYSTMQIMRHDIDRFEGLECSEIAVITPSVSSKSGLDAKDYVTGIADKIAPDVIIAIDALASRSPARLGRTIQLSDTGISPGSGVGNTVGRIDKSSTGVPVISVGVPTVMDSRHFSSDGFLTGEPMFVSPREIDGIISSAAKIIGGAINQAFGIYDL